MSKILSLNFNIQKSFLTYFEFKMVVMLGKLEWWYKVFYLFLKNIDFIDLNFRNL